MSIIRSENVIFEYENKDEEGNELQPFRALDGVSMEVFQGEFIAILGHNGSGKSTFAKHLNALLLPGEGRVYIDKMDTLDSDNTLKIREKAGMVFQNPDNQIVASVVEEEVAFGPENLGIEPSEIRLRVDKALEAVGMLAYKENSPNRLSGGQKQRVAIAGIIAMRPKCIILDEPTAMLDPKGRRDVISVLHELNKKESVTIILITHNMEEVIEADRIFVMDGGKIVMNGSPREVFSKVEALKELSLDVPEVTKLSHELIKAGIDLPKDILTSEELVKALNL